MRHFVVHSMVPASRLGFVKQGEEPKRDSYGDYEKYLDHFGFTEELEEETEIAKDQKLKSQKPNSRLVNDERPKKIKKTPKTDPKKVKPNI